MQRGLQSAGRNVHTLILLVSQVCICTKMQKIVHCKHAFFVVKMLLLVSYVLRKCLESHCVAWIFESSLGCGHRKYFLSHSVL